MAAPNFAQEFETTVRNPIETSLGREGKAVALLRFAEMVQRDPVAACDYILDARGFNGIISPVEFMDMAMTPDALAGIPQERLNNTLPKVARTVCFYGDAQRGFPILERMISAGARLSRDESVVLDTPDKIQAYADHVAVRDSQKYGPTISRGSAGYSQWAQSVANNPLADRLNHDAFGS